MWRGAPQAAPGSRQRSRTSKRRVLQVGWSGDLAMIHSSSFGTPGRADKSRPDRPCPDLRLSGIETVPVEVQVQITSGLPALLLVGLPDKAVGEARERMRAALNAMGLALPPRRVLINLAPADLLKEGSHFDLPIALGCWRRWMWCRGKNSTHMPRWANCRSTARSTRWPACLPAAIGASTHDLGLICPASQGGEAAWAGRSRCSRRPIY